jgi:hypothetical protein
VTLVDEDRLTLTFTRVFKLSLYSSIFYFPCSILTPLFFVFIFCGVFLSFFMGHLVIVLPIIHRIMTFKYLFDIFKPFFSLHVIIILLLFLKTYQSFIRYNLIHSYVTYSIQNIVLVVKLYHIQINRLSYVWRLVLHWKLFTYTVYTMKYVINIKIFNNYASRFSSLRHKWH